MTIQEAQRQTREIYLGGGPGQMVCAAIWLASAAAGTWAAPRLAILILVIGGMFIFPLTQLALRAMGRPASLAPDNPLRWLALQVAFMVPLCLPVVLGATAHRLGWFYPGAMIVVGAHYLPFQFLYGQQRWLVLGGVLIVAGLMIGLYLSNQFALGGWLTAVVFLVFAFWAAASRREPVSA
jgi:Family of unknown function (DUF7010)